MSASPRSAVLHSAFSPSRFQLSLFASVIQSLDSHLLRIQDTISGRLRCEHTVQRASVTCLDWGRYGAADAVDPTDEQPLKKRRRKVGADGVLEGGRGDVVVALGTSHSEIQLFSPAHAKVIHTFRDGLSRGIRDFRFGNTEAWSLDGDGKLVQWSLLDGSMQRTILSPSPTVQTLLPLPRSLLVASETAYLIDPARPAEPRQYAAAYSPVHTLVVPFGDGTSDGPLAFLAASEASPDITVFDIPSSADMGSRLIGSLRAEDDIEALNYYEVKEGKEETRSVLIALTKTGQLDVFYTPFDWNSAVEKDSKDIKANRKDKTRKANAQIKVARPDKSASPVFILSALVQDSEIVLALAEGGVQVDFHRITWRNADPSVSPAIQGSVVIQKAKSSALEAGMINGVKNMGKTQIDESRTLISQGGNVPLDDHAGEESNIIDISSAEEESSASDEDVGVEGLNDRPNGDIAGDGEDEEMQDAGSEGEAATAVARAAKDDESEEDVPVEGEEPTFGDLIRANAPETVDVTKEYPNAAAQAVTPFGGGRRELPSGMSLGTVLTQSLRTNDTSLLETCFHVQDLHIVRATIERLDSALATTLLQKLAERLHSRPGRAGSLMVWIQWTLVAHGGYLATQQDIVRKLASLHRVVSERASSLQPLLALKGKLDMLEAQMSLRKKMQQRYGAADADGDEDENVIYVEGQDDSSSSGSDEDEAGPQAHDRLGTREVEISSGDESEDMPNTFEGQIDEDSDEEPSDMDGLIDDEASEASNDSDGEDFADEVDHDDADSFSEEESEEEQDAKGKARVNGTTSKRT